MNEHKKKHPRQRNRPKNKVNRQQTHAPDLQQEEEQKLAEGNLPLQATPQPKQSQQLESIKKLQEQFMSTSGNQVATQVANDDKNDEAIKIVQQLLRAKFLRQTKDTKTKKDMRIQLESAAPAARSHEATSIAEIISEAIPTPAAAVTPVRISDTTPTPVATPVTAPIPATMPTPPTMPTLAPIPTLVYTATTAAAAAGTSKTMSTPAPTPAPILTPTVTIAMPGPLAAPTPASKPTPAPIPTQVSTVTPAAATPETTPTPAPTTAATISTPALISAAAAPTPQKKVPNYNAVSGKKSKSKDSVADQHTATEKNAFIANLQRKMETAMANGSTDLSNTLLDNLQKLINQDPISDVETSDDEDEYIEYIYKPRQYFLVSLCNYCKSDLRAQPLIQCTRCRLTYYCTLEHMKRDEAHRQLCHALRQVADSCGGHIFYNCKVFTTEQFRSYRIVTMRKVEDFLNRKLTATEQEVILFPRICGDASCREYRFDKLQDCLRCGQVAYCKDNPAHLNKAHHVWCQPYQLFKELIMFQEKFGRLDPSLPAKVLRDLPGACSNTKQILQKLCFDVKDPCEYAALSQISTCPLTAWYGLKLCDQLKKSDRMTIHLIGAEIEFEVDVLHKWELFFLHITPTLKELHIVFIGPELNPRNISFEQLRKTKCCRICRKNSRFVQYHFQNQIYHEYCRMSEFLPPDLICFFNAGLYRCTGFQMEDTWPDTILAASNLKCPVVVTSYTAYEAPLDMTRFVQECNRRLNVVLPPIVNPFASAKPERNFISEDDAPLMFKNFYCFVVE